MTQINHFFFVISFLVFAGNCMEHSVPRNQIRSLRTIGTPIPDTSEFSFRPENMVDGNLETSWQTSSPHNSGVIVEFQEPVDLTHLQIANGFQWTNHYRYGNLLEKNSRVATIALGMEIEGSDGSISSVTKEITLRDRTMPGYDEIEVAQRKVKRIAFRPLSIYQGSQWKDLAISEVRFMTK